MMSQDIKLWETNAPEMHLCPNDTDNQGLPTLTPYLIQDGKTHPAVIVCPGGGFRHRAPHEGGPIAEWLNSIGISAFVLNYRVAPYAVTTSVKDAVRSIRFVRYNAKRYHVDPDRIGMIGFSAGGYLTAVMGTNFDNGTLDPNTRNGQIRSMVFNEGQGDDPVDRTSSKLSAMILCYAAISVRRETVDDNLLPPGVSLDEFIRAASTENHVSSKTPPAFIWVTVPDPYNFAPENMVFAQELSKHQVPYELHVFSRGGHGLGLGQDEPAVAVWPKLCADWLVRTWGLDNSFPSSL